ncbi:MAG: bifunctional metallophosphatase/5'-nucleotidase [Erysipelotrichaceae bacterium]|nr:bifunctional metallophosphatase/5'-nucleotidase [Erysipelotrichaceae bacterium]
MTISELHILNHADYDGEFREDEKTPGLSRFYCAVEQVRSRDPEHCLLLDAGDNINRILWHGREVFDGLALIGTDAMTLGNHEFDRGREQLEENIAHINETFPILCSNIVYKDTGEFIRGTKPYVIIEKAGIKYGIIGCTTEYTPYMVTASAFAPFRAESEVEALRKYIPMARNEGAEVIIGLCHFPFYFDEQSESGELIDVIDQIIDLKPDVMIGGHIPGDYARVYRGVAVTKGGFSGKSLPHVTLQFNEESRKVVGASCEIIDVLHDHFDHDAEIDAFVSRVTAPYQYYFDEVIGHMEKTLKMRLTCESEMGDFLCDAIRDRMKTDVVYFNTTSCGREFPAGDITRYSILSVMGFNDPLMLTEMTGKQIWELFELVHEPERYGNNGNIMFAGLNVKMDHTRPAGHKVVWIRDDHGNDIDPERLYTVTTSEYMASGGNDTSLITRQLKYEDSGVLIHDALYDYIISRGRITPPQTGRYIFIGEPENDNSPW